ncbi:hypothetical protein Cgig2_018701 [Carnegiea gigantea]|uniref:Uncharacterized protein n=1 Tax=Carnegiea gigantea TaxID=171969 RepID=A0A9Q1QHX0_9CARY|nr:hypothetical protein Cgig2_018701 [Carnegiea gigantea]
MVVLRPRIPKDLNSKAAPAPISLSKLRQAKAKKIREEGAKAYADQCDRCAVTTLNHFNQLAASNMGVTYEFVKAGCSTGFMHREQGLIFHCNFLAKPIKCSDDSETYRKFIPRTQLSLIAASLVLLILFAWEIMVVELVALTYIIPQRDFTLVKSNMNYSNLVINTNNSYAQNNKDCNSTNMQPPETSCNSLAGL